MDKTAIRQELDDIIQSLQDREPTKEEETLIEELEDKLDEKKEGAKEDKRQELLTKIDTLATLISQNDTTYKETNKSLLEAISQIKLNVEAPIVNVEAPKVDVTVPDIKIPEIKIPKTEINYPDIMKIAKPSWYEAISLKPVIDEIKKIKFPEFKLPTTASNPISVRLSDGTKFYRAMNGLMSAVGSSFPFAKSNKEVQSALVDNEGYVQTDIRSSALPSGAATSANQTNGTQASQFVSELGVSYGVKHINNKPRVSAMDYLYDIAEGNVADHISWGKMGYNDNIGTTEGTMWSNSSQYVFPTVAGQMEVVSSDNTQDKAGGTGALTVRIGYLKSNYTESSVTLTMNGTAAVPTGASHADIWRIQSFRVMTAGTNNAPVGNLTLRILGGGATHGYIRLGKTRARSCFYTVPLGKVLYVTSVAFSAAGTKYLIFTTHANYDNVSATLLPRGLFHPYSEVALLNSAYHKELEIPTKLPATVDLKVSVIAEAAGSIGTCNLRGWLELA